MNGPLGLWRRSIRCVNEKLGFPGAACSMDGVHIHWGRCHSKQRALHTGREGYPTRVYNVACDLMRRVLHVIEHSHPGACNDRTIVRFDELVIRIHRRELYSDVEFELKQKDGTTRTHKGLHALVDGGYHSWRCLICPVKVAQDSKLLHFSKRLEPTRKDVECLFGISSGAFACCAFRSSSKPRASSTTCSRRITLRRSQRDCDWISARMNDVDEGIGNGFARPPAADAAAGNEVEVSVEESRFDLHEALVEHYHQQCVSESSFWMRTAVQAHRARRAQQEQE
uniref:DDE Tnp4 domain-containing protein n=1 Tax=Chrysotila carterae TaxID=13221 RepID=A0A6S9S3X3_CHRCT|mmetsp:Transcript_1985/g.4095  ORF Transcript_1985/g.4095 Transcript_1985/m.4095 type:complete len:283 (-) Transcript_1985:286-1134(-)